MSWESSAVGSGSRFYVQGESVRGEPRRYWVVDREKNHDEVPGTSTTDKRRAQRKCDKLNGKAPGEVDASAPKRKPAKRPTLNDLTRELFVAVERHQGVFAYSDDPQCSTTSDFFDMVRTRLRHGKKAVAKTEAFLRKYGELK